MFEVINPWNINICPVCLEVWKESFIFNLCRKLTWSLWTCHSSIPDAWPVHNFTQDNVGFPCLPYHIIYPCVVCDSTRNGKIQLSGQLSPLLWCTFVQLFQWPLVPLNCACHILVHSPTRVLIVFVHLIKTMVASLTLSST